MTPKATKRKNPDEVSQGEQSVKRVKLSVSDTPDAVQEEEVVEQVQETTKPIPPAAMRRKIKKLTPPRPYPTVPASVSATGPRSAHSEGKNYICVTRKTPLAAYLRRCKDVIQNDG